jgi:hypothetical protein
MKSKILPITLTTCGITLGTMSLFTPPSYAGDTTFYCNSDNTLWISPPHTRDIPLIEFRDPAFSNWQNNQGQKYQPAIRCNAVKEKLQRYFDCNSSDRPLDFLAGATFTRQEEQDKRYYPVILTTLNPSTTSRQCLAEIADLNPKIEGLLFMLPPVPDINQAAAKAQDAIDKIEEIRFYAVGDPIEN